MKKSKIPPSSDPRAPQYFVDSEGRGMMRMPDGKVVGPFDSTPEEHKARGDKMFAALVKNLNSGDRKAP